MVKHTQTIRQQFADKLFESVWPFYGVGAYRDIFQMSRRLPMHLTYNSGLNILAIFKNLAQARIATSTTTFDI